MAAIVWNAKFDTGLADVDLQHRHLVFVINQVADLYTADADQAALAPLLQELIDYTQYHFSTEERLMAQHGCVPEHVREHVQIHQDFFRQVQMIMVWGREHPAEAVPALLRYLTSWLVHHILGSDQVMARQIHAQSQGLSPQQAYAQEEPDHGLESEALVSTLQTLYDQVAAQNRELAARNSELEAARNALHTANTDLEQRVTARTQELAAANQQLLAEHHAQQALIAKLEEAQNQLLQSEKMAAIGQLAAGVAHEINNPIGFVTSNFSSLSQSVDNMLHLVQAYEHLPPDLAQAVFAVPAIAQARQQADLAYLADDVRDVLRESLDGLDRVRRIVRDLRDFSHVDESEWQDADLNAGLESTLNVAWNEIKYKAKLDKQLAPLPLVRCIPAQINQVLLNILVNAAQAIDQDGLIQVRSSAAEGWVCLEVQDNGRGMSPAVQKRIFEPFFTTKPVGKGTGLGLSLSYNIIKKHGGRIEVSSTPGQGSCFRIYLPVQQAH